ncbi:hypothetical protein SAMN02910447_01681 [Ruminococcus sp. YE71]|uniref:hypothetical protein n=1 Tax=unclassified Ruminococcus TaxID=2608920 RepID=UPI0008925338|nr:MULTISPECIES: hypothetical protein [unclassified Ruminococcus]SDA20100.1 hypothetical protein SAMN02910446_01682 [Ruminococcus sp. YE78]SFW31818.1 hypothetical protein SAMN02910447_01681 [Ruminococcus sp. YE71]
MTKKELIELIDTSGDIMFDCEDKHYTILTWTDEGIFIGEQITETQKKDRHEYFKTGEQLVSEFLVNGKPLGDICDRIVITFSN